MKSLKVLSLYGLSGILLGVGFLYPSLWLLGLLGVALQLNTLAKQTRWQIWGSYLAWTIKFFFVLGFYWTIYPIRWLPFDFGGGELLLIGLYWLTVSMFVGTSGLVFGVFYKLTAMIISSSRWIVYLLVPVMWVAAEIAGSFLLSLFTYGPGSLINGYFSLGYIGLLLAEHQFLLLLAQFGGVYLLSAVVVVVAVWLSQSTQYRVKSFSIILPAGFLVALLLSGEINAPTITAPANTTSVAVINTSFPVEEAFNRDNITNLLQEQDRALAAAVSTNASYILTPEDARFFDQSNDVNLSKSYFNFKYPETDVIIIDSGRVQLGNSGVLQGVIFDSNTNQHSTIHKKYLVPQGEFVPYFYAGLFRALGFGYVIDELQQIVSYTIGPNTSQANLPEQAPGVLFCFESSSGTGVRSLLRERPELPFIAHPVSHTWFNEPKSLWSQLEASLQVQAVWNDVAIVSAAQHAPSQLFLPDGSIVTPRLIDSGEHWEVGLFSVPIR